MLKSIITILMLLASVIGFSQDFIVEVENNRTAPCVDETIRINHPDDLNSNWEINVDHFEIIGSVTNTSTLEIKCLVPVIDTITAISGLDTGWVVLTVSDVSANFTVTSDPLNASIINVLSDSLFQPYVYPITFKWDFDDGTIMYDTVNSVSTGEIYRSSKRHSYADEIATDSIFDISLVVENSAGCYDSVQITDTIHTTFSAPNIITPNNDGRNDFFTAKTSGNVKFSMKVFSRWGNVVFESEKPSTSVVWDGRLRSGQLVSSGVYFYVIEPVDNANAEKLTGFVHVMTPKE